MHPTTYVTGVLGLNIISYWKNAIAPIPAVALQTKPPIRKKVVFDRVILIEEIIKYALYRLGCSTRLLDLSRFNPELES